MDVACMRVGQVQHLFRVISDSGGLGRTRTSQSEPTSPLCHGRRALRLRLPNKLEDLPRPDTSDIGVSRTFLRYRSFQFRVWVPRAVAKSGPTSRAAASRRGRSFELSLASCLTSLSSCFDVF